MRNKGRAGKTLIVTGILMLVSALCLTGYNFYDEFRAGMASGHILESLEQTSLSSQESDNLELPDYIINPDMEMPTIEIEGNDYIGVLQIPSLELTLPVISQWSYPGLRVAPCRYSGSVYSGSMVVAGHNYRTCFGRIGTLTNGEQVLFTDVKGRTFRYEVAGTETINADDAEEMISEEWDLTLFTCTLGGKARVAVRCQRIVHINGATAWMN